MSVEELESQVESTKNQLKVEVAKLAIAKQRFEEVSDRETDIKADDKDNSKSQSDIDKEAIEDNIFLKIYKKIQRAFAPTPAQQTLKENGLDDFADNVDEMPPKDLKDLVDRCEEFVEELTTELSALLKLLAEERKKQEEDEKNKEENKEREEELGHDSSKDLPEEVKEQVEKSGVFDDMEETITGKESETRAVDLPEQEEQQEQGASR